MFLHVSAFLYNLIVNKNVKLATFFILSIRRIFPKLLAISESSIKLKVRSHGTFFVILLTSGVICMQIFCIETRVYIVFKTANAITLVKIILESP